MNDGDKKLLIYLIIGLCFAVFFRLYADEPLPIFPYIGVIIGWPMLISLFIIVWASDIMI